MKAILVDWFSGKPLLAVEDTIAKFVAANEGSVPQPTKADKKGKFARRFSIRFASEISLVMSTFAQLVKEVELAKGTELPPMPGLLPQLVRFGFPTPYHFALSLELETSARVEVNRRYDELAKHLIHDVMMTGMLVVQRYKVLILYLCSQNFQKKNLKSLWPRNYSPPLARFVDL